MAGCSAIATSVRPAPYEQARTPTREPAARSAATRPAVRGNVGSGAGCTAAFQPPEQLLGDDREAGGGGVATCLLGQGLPAGRVAQQPEDLLGQVAGGRSGVQLDRCPV